MQAMRQQASRRNIWLCHGSREHQGGIDLFTGPLSREPVLSVHLTTDDLKPLFGLVGSAPFFGGGRILKYTSGIDP